MVQVLYTISTVLIGIRNDNSFNRNKEWFAMQHFASRIQFWRRSSKEKRQSIQCCRYYLKLEKYNHAESFETNCIENVRWLTKILVLMAHVWSRYLGKGLASVVNKCLKSEIVWSPVCKYLSKVVCANTWPKSTIKTQVRGL